jgi:uncharacterized membrane protein YgcG
VTASGPRIVSAVRRPATRRIPRPLAVLVFAAVAGLALVAAAGRSSAALGAGPPFPPPNPGQAVYDTAGVFRDATVQQVEQTIDAIEARTGAEVVVYTQLVPDFTTDDDARQQAAALIDQWGVGRRGFDDGLAILFDLYENDPCHGRVQLYAGPGFSAEFLSNAERQSIFDNTMLPLLKRCDLDGALLVAMSSIDDAATPEHAQQLSFFRQLNAALGLLVAPLLLVLLAGWALLAWIRHGRDPVYLDDPSIHIPAPPPGLTPAAGAVVRDGRSTRRALTTASLDLASRGLIAFDATQAGLLGKSTELSIRTTEASTTDPVEQARLDRARGRPMDDATEFLHHRMLNIAGGDQLIDKTQLLRLGTDVSGFDSRIEQHVVKQGWFTEPPAKATGRWLARGILAIIAGAILGFIAFNLPSDGLLLVAGAAIGGGVVMLVLSRSMPSRTMPGAMIRAMLEAYRRTLEKTMAQARSMGEVVETSAIPLIESPDDAVVWGVALGLQTEVEAVLRRTAEDVEAGVAPFGYVPAWYATGGLGGGSGGGPSGWAPGVMSSSPIPNFGGMMAALGTIGNSPASSGSGGGGGFGGGGSGGGGGGAGGGF